MIGKLIGVLSGNLTLDGCLTQRGLDALNEIADHNFNVEMEARHERNDAQRQRLQPQIERNNKRLEEKRAATQAYIENPYGPYASRADLLDDILGK